VPAAAPAAPAAAPIAGAPRLEHLISILIPALALPVLVTSLLGWTFGLPFIAIGLIVSGRVLGRATAAGAATGVGPVLRASAPARTALKGIAAVSAAAIVVAVVLALATRHSTHSATPAADFPVAPVTTAFGPDPAGQREAREARATVREAQAAAAQREQARLRAEAKSRAAAKEKRDKRERDKLIKQGLLNPDGTLTPLGQAQGVTPPGAAPGTTPTQPATGTAPSNGTTTQPAPSGTSTTPTTTTP
jgi:hypothetical protein